LTKIIVCFYILIIDWQVNEIIYPTLLLTLCNTTSGAVPLDSTDSVSEAAGFEPKLAETRLLMQMFTAYISVYSSYFSRNKIAILPQTKTQPQLEEMEVIHTTCLHGCLRGKEETTVLIDKAFVSTV
jgi:hypothetical protein